VDANTDQQYVVSDKGQNQHKGLVKMQQNLLYRMSVLSFDVLTVRGAV